MSRIKSTRILGFLMGNGNSNKSKFSTSEKNLESQMNENHLDERKKFFSAPPQRIKKTSLLKKTIYSIAMFSTLMSFGLYKALENSDIRNGTSNRELSSIKEFTVQKSDLNKSMTDEIRESLAKGELPDVLNGSAPEVIEKIKNGQMAFYSIRMIDTIAQDGDVVKVSINGLPVGIVTLSHVGAYISLPLQPGHINSLQIQAIEDGGGGVTFGAFSSTGEVYTKIMKVGDIEVWQIGGI